MKKVLVIDDEPHVLQVVKARLQANDYSVETADTGKEGLKIAAEWQPHLILLDITMPGMSGFEVLQRLKGDSATAKIPVVMLSASGETANIFEAEKLWAVDFVIKPFSSDDLLTVIRRNVKAYEA